MWACLLQQVLGASANVTKYLPIVPTNGLLPEVHKIALCLALFLSLVHMKKKYIIGEEKYLLMESTSIFCKTRSLNDK